MPASEKLEWLECVVKSDVKQSFNSAFEASSETIK